MVGIEEVAIADRDGEMKFYINKEIDGVEKWSINTSLVQGEGIFGLERQAVSVGVVSLVPYLKQCVDILKLDIQGYETVVLAQIEPLLSNVGEIFLEYHGKTIDPRNDLAEIMRILEGKYAHIELKQEGKEVDLCRAISCVFVDRFLINPML